MTANGESVSSATAVSGARIFLDDSMEISSIFDVPNDEWKYNNGTTWQFINSSDNICGRLCILEQFFYVSPVF